MAKQQTIPFDEFEKHFINHPWGFMPVDIGLVDLKDDEDEGEEDDDDDDSDEDDEGEDDENEASQQDDSDEGSFRKAIWLDMIYPPRLADGKVLFLTVEFETPEQLDAILAWVRLAAEELRRELVEKTEPLFGREAIKWE